MKITNVSRSLITLILLVSIYGAFIISQPKLLGTSSLYFGEFVQSTNFSQLLLDSSHSFSYRLYGGTYNLGLPYPPAKETVYGTQRGSRTLPLLLFFTGLQKLFGPFWDKIYFLLVLTAPFAGFYSAVRLITPRPHISQLLAGSLFFAFNPWIFSRLQTGFWQLHLAYACIPFVYIYLTNIIFSKKRDIRNEFILVTIAILCLAAIYAFQPHFLLMLSIPVALSIMYSIFILKVRTFQISALRAIVLTLGFVCINAYHLIPSLVYTPFTITTLGQDLNLASVLFNGQGSRLIDVLKLTPIGPMQFATYQLTQLDYLSYGFLTFVGLYILVSLIYAQSKIKTIKALIVPILSILIFGFLAKGLGDPFSEVSKTVYKHFILKPFRDPSRFYGMIVLFSSLIFVYIQPRTYRIRNVVLVIALPWFVYTLLQMIPLTTSQFKFTRIPENRYTKTTQEGDMHRTMYFPQNVPMSEFTWMQNDVNGSNNNPTLALIPLPQPQSTYSGFADTYFNQLGLYTAHQSLLGSPSAHLDTKMLTQSYVIDESVVSDVLKKSTTQQIDTLKKQYAQIPAQSSGVTSLQSTLPVQLISDSQPLFAVGDLQTFSTIASRRGDKPLILLNQPHNAKEFKKLSLSRMTIIADKTSELKNLHLHTLDAYSLDLTGDVIDNETEWSMHEAGIQDDIRNGMLYTSGRSIEPKAINSTLTVKRDYLKGDYIVAMRYKLPEEIGRINLTLNRKKFSVNHNNNSRLQWVVFDPVTLQNPSTITLATQNSRLNIIDDILIIPKKVFDESLRDYDDIFRKNTIVEMSNLEATSVVEPRTSALQTSFETWELNSQSPWTTLRMPFDYGWHISGQKGVFIGDYYGMTFLSTQERAKKITYKHEKIFATALTISILTTVGISIFLLDSLRRRVG